MGSTDQLSMGFDAVLFDMDGVVTRTAELHAAAWKALFDDFLRARESDTPFRAFDAHGEYLAHVDGRPRHEGVRTFLAARGIELPEGAATDDADSMTIHGLGARKDALFKSLMHRDGVTVFASTIALVRALRQRGVKTAVVTSSRNGREVLRAADIEGLFDVRVDGIDAQARKLEGKPHPAPFLEAARLLGTSPGRAVVIEDAVSGVEAGRRGGFGLVVGVDRGGNRAALLEHGADVVVRDLDEIDIEGISVRLRSKRASITAWQIEQEGFDPAREHALESLFTIGNGYLGVRGALDTPLPGSQGDLFIAGIYDRKHPARPYSELEFEGVGRGDYPYSELVSAPFPFRLQMQVDGKPLDLAGSLWRQHRRVLDLRKGVLHAHARYETDVDCHARVHSYRCASRHDLHLLLQQITIRLENHSGTVVLDASLADPDLAANHPHLTPVAALEDEQGLDVLHFRTQASGFDLCMAARTTLLGSGRDATVWRLPATIGQTLTFRRFIVVYTSRDLADPRRAAVQRLRSLHWDAFEHLLDAHTACWKETWQRADVRIAGSPSTEQALRFNAYHLVSAADHDPCVSVGARALSGRAYEGHVFWDVEIFKLPFYLHTCPEVARNLLLYRHHTLAGARRRARELGYRGACYAWESTVTGDDVTPSTIHLRTTGKQIPIFTGTQQLHVTAGVAHGVWSYWLATGDHAFLRDAGIEILLETARFWTSRCSAGPRGLHIRQVVGPDEYHHSVDDNAYTNWMARYNLERAVQGARWMQRDHPQAWSALAERCALAHDETDQWTAVAGDLYCPQPDARGVIEQFAGFFELEEYALPKGERFKAPISRLFDWERINRLQLIKQADVLMLLHLFPDLFPHEVLAANYRYYEPITDHGSSLSPAIHAAAAARLGLADDAERYWCEALWLDLSNTMSNSALGIHPACMGASWQALVFGFLGIRFEHGAVVVDPNAGMRLPAKWRSVALELAWNGRLHPVNVARQEVR